MSPALTDPLTLPCGATLKNRIVKGAMTEGMGTPDNCATDDHAALYGRWARGGAGLLLTGNVQIDRRFVERPGNVAIDGNAGLDELAAYAAAGRENGAHIWMQINHPGRQAGASPDTFVAPSAMPLVGGAGMCRALNIGEIHDIQRRFVHVALTARDTGFTGVQVHAAHGYLLSQFLSPLTNKRDDDWGDSLENRARLLLDIVSAIRAATGPDFPVSVKLNSADFQKGGLTEEESIQIVHWLCAAGIDLLEISGGSYESQVMVGREQDGTLLKKASTIAREAYFLDFAARLRPHVSVPLAVTGGFRSRAAMAQALETGALDAVGIARPLCLDAGLIDALLDGRIDRLPSPDDQPGTAAQATIAYYFNQIRRLATGDPIETDIDWQAQLDQHTAYDAALTQRYLATFAS